MEDVRALAIVTEQRYELAPMFPTLKEQGVNVISIKRRGLAAPSRAIPRRIGLNIWKTPLRNENDIPDIKWM